MSSREFGSEINRDNLDNVDAVGEEHADAKPVLLTAPSSVAHLRSFLDDFGRKNKEHFEKSKATSASADHVQKSPIRRPKIRSTIESGPTPLSKEAASVLVRRIMKPSSGSSISTTSTKFKANAEINKEVEATNEGYASVEKLCKWLADDPTTTKKKAPQLRRGANVLAKSRAFDKGLVNAIAVEHKIKQGCVAEHKKHFERSSILNNRRGTIGMRPERKSWGVPKPATSEVVTRSDDLDAHAEAVKQQWRLQQPKMQHTKMQHTKMQQPKLQSKIHQPMMKQPMILQSKKEYPPAEDSTTEVGEDEDEDLDDDRSEVGSSVTVVTAKVPQVSSSSQLLDSIITDHENETEASMFLDTPSEYSHASSSKSSLDFRQVRDIAVKRSESNGSAEEMVQQRKKKFEKLQRELRRKTGTHGLLKASWEGEEGNYVKKYISDIPPKRALHELP